jgi:hypothetical protein
MKLRWAFYGCYPLIHLKISTEVRSDSLQFDPQTLTFVHEKPT